MKLVLRDGTELKINSIFKLSDSILSISFKEVSSFDSLRTKLTANNLSIIKVIYTSEVDGEEVVVNTEIYERYTIINDTKVTGISESLDVAVQLQVEDEVATRLRTLEVSNELLTRQLAEAKQNNLLTLEAIAQLYEMLL